MPGLALVPPSCRPRIVSSDSPLAKLFFLAGVEGAGHELFERFFANLNVNLTYEKFEPDLHLTFEEGQKTEDPKCSALPYARHPVNFGAQAAARLQTTIQACAASGYTPTQLCQGIRCRKICDFSLEHHGDMNQADVRVELSMHCSRTVPLYAEPNHSPMASTAFRCTESLGWLEQFAGSYLRARDPFPMGRIRTPLARPDLVSLALFDGILYDLKVLVLVHEPREMVAWSVAKKYDGNDVGRQVRMVEDSLVYLDASVRMLHCGSYAVFDTPLLSKHPDAMVDKLTEFLELPVTKDEVRKALRVARTEWLTGSAEDLPLFHGKSLDYFFEGREPMWPLLSACRGVLPFRPTRPSHWPSS
eukprot:SM000261S09979  [mRNA]  locus=s261:147798:150152:- [translate_table: standard]